jgi:methionyl-tRNA formyltransferase
VRLVFAGTPEVALPPLRALLDSPRHEVVAVITRPDAEVGRGRHLHRSPVAALAAERGLEILAPHRAGDPDFLARLAELAPDCCPVVAYGALLRQAALDVPRHGWVNLHFSVLPAWRGAAPVQAAIMAGDEVTGASTFRIVPELDSGPVYGVVTEDIGPHDTAGTLLERLAGSGAELLSSTMDGVEDGTLQPREQPTNGVSYAAKIATGDAHLDFTRPAHIVDRVARAVTPAPGAWAEFRGERVKLSPVNPATDAEPLGPGELAVYRREVMVGTATTPVRLGHVQAAGKKRMPATDWARGARIEPGETLR